MIFVAFLVPLALYLLILAYINRQPRPFVVSGVWDFIGILFAASGFLLFGGPALLSSVHERWRMFWLLGEGVDRDSLLSTWQFWTSLSVLYFLTVIGVCALVFWRQRRLTSVYNVEPASVEAALEEACEQLGIDAIRSGNLFVFGLALGSPNPARATPTGIQRPHLLARGARPIRGPEAAEAAPEEFAGQSAVLELESFAALKHVTLRWDPHDTPLRPVLEAELERRLIQAGSPYHDTAAWLNLAALALLSLAFFVVLFLVIRTLYLR